MAATDWLTTAEAAEISGVGTTSIKRWTEEGVLPCSKTAGGHRRIRRDDLQAFLRAQRGEDARDSTRRWLDLMMNADAHRLEGALLEARGGHRSWSEVADELGPALVQMGEDWEQQQVSVLEEHVASERLSRAVARIAETLPVHTGAPVCLLACLEGETHTLGLRLAELCLREAGWRTLWVGQVTPVDEVVRTVVADEVEMVALSASVVMNDAKLMASHAERVGAACKEVGIPLALGGSGAWPEEGYNRFHSFEAFQRFATEQLRSGL